MRITARRLIGEICRRWVRLPGELVCHSLSESHCDEHRRVIDLLTQQLCLKCSFFHLCFFFFFLSNFKPRRPSAQRIRVISSSSSLGEQQQQQHVDSVAWRPACSETKIEHASLLLRERERGKLSSVLPMLENEVERVRGMTLSPFTHLKTSKKNGTSTGFLGEGEKETALISFSLVLAESISQLGKAPFIPTCCRQE